MTKQWIGIEEAAKKYQVTSQRIAKWCKQEQVTYSRVGQYQMIDEESLIACIERNKRLSLSAVELQCRTDQILRENEQELFLLRSMKELTPVMRVLINELAELLPHAEQKRLFLYVALRGNFREYGKECCRDYYQLCLEFKTLIREINSQAGFLLTSARKMAYLRAVVDAYQKKFGILPAKEIKMAKPTVKEKKAAFLLLATPLMHLGFSRRAVLGMNNSRLYTLYDLMLFLYKYGTERLNRLYNIGGMTQCEIVNRLKEMGVLDDEGNSYLYKHLNGKPYSLDLRGR